MIVSIDGSLVGTIGGGAVEREIAAEAARALEEGKPRVVRRHLTHDLAMCCGGEMEFFIEPIGRREIAVLVGAGHISHALAPVLTALGFEVVVADEMEE